jgi:hypothetical protein
LPIGAADANIFDCPRCRRPLAAGTAHCPGCGAFLIGGVRATVAVSLLATGLLVGLIGGTAGTAAVLTAVRPEPIAVVEPVPVAPTAMAAAVPSVTHVDPIDSSVPAAARSALRQSAVVDARLLADAERLSVVLAAKDVSTAELARLLRSMTANAGVGERLATDLAGWSAAASLGMDLEVAYRTVQTTAAAALASSVTNTRAYVDAGTNMLAVVRDLAGLDAAARQFAAAHDIAIDAPVAPQPS